MNKFKRMLQVAFGALFLVCVMLFAASCNLFGTSEPPTDDTVYAVTVSMNDESLGEVTLEGDKVGDGYRAGSKLKVTVIPIEDYEAELAINGESVELDEQGSVEVVVNEALAIDADFEYIYTVNVVNDDLKGTVVIGPEDAYDETTGLYAKDAQLTVTVTPKENFVVAGIKHNGADVQFTPDAETGACSFSFTLSERAYITVEYTALHEVKLTQNGEGSVTLDGEDYANSTVEEGTEVTLTLTPASGFILGDVYVNGALTPVTEDGTVTFTVKGETEVTVNFVALRRVYVQQCLGDAVTATSCGTVEVTGETYNTPLSKHAAEGDTLTVHAVPAEDYTLEKITVNGEEIDAVNGIGSFTVKGDKDGRVYVRVYWAKKLYTIEYSSGDAQIRGDLLLVNKAFPKNTYESGESLPSGIEVNLKMTPKPGFTVEFLRINNDTIYYVGKSNKLVYDDAGSWLYNFIVKSDLEMHVEFKEAPHFDIDLDNGLAEKGATLSEPTTQLGALNVTLKDSNGGEHTIPNPYYDEELADKYYYGEKITVSAGEGNIFTEDVVLKDKTGAEFDRIPIQEKDWLNEVSFYATRETVVSTNVKLLTHDVTINYGNGIDESVTFNVKHDFKLNLKDLTANLDLKTEGGDPVTLVNPEWADHRLVGWRVEGSEDLIDVEELFVVEKDDVVINAVWQETYVLTVTVSGINGVEGARVELTIVDTKTKEPIADRGPIDDVTTDGVQTFVLDKGMSMKAEAYAPITHKIDIWNGLGIWVTPNPEATEVHVGLTLNGDIGIVFAPYNHNVTLTSNEGGAATLTNGEDPVETPAEIPNGTTLTLKAVPDATYRVKSVKVNGDEIELNAENVYSIRITEPTEIEVEFVKTYTVTIQIDGDTTLGEVHVYKVTEGVETELENGSLFDEGDTIKVVMSENDEDNEHIWVVLYADMDVRLYNPEYPDSYDGYYGPEDGVSQWGEVNETWQGTAKSDIKVHIYLNKYYKVSADYDQTQGTIVYGEEEYRFNHEFYVAGAQVALTVKAKEGYRIGAIEAEGVTITADLNALVTSYELTFSMPANEVQITVTYVKTYKVEDCTIITPDLAEDPVTVLYGEGVHGFREDGSPIEGTEMKTGDIVDAGATFCVIVNPVTGYCFSRDSVIKGGNISISGALLNGDISLGYMTITKDVTVHLVIVQRELFDVTMSVKDINHEEENVSDYVKLSDPYFKDTTTKYFYDETVTVNAVEEYQTVEYDEAKGVFTSVTHYYLVKKVTVNGSDVTAGADGKFSFKVRENTDVQVEVVRLFKVDLMVDGDTYNEEPVGHTTFLSGETVYGHDGEAVWIEENSKLDVSVELYNTDFLLTNSLIVSEKEWLSKDEVVYKTEGTGRAGWSVTFSVTHDIYARIKYVRYQFHVTVDPANGEGSSSTEHETRDGFRLPEEPATKPENCRFGGWKVTYADGTPEEIRQPGELLKPSDNITVTAVWVETYTVTLNVTGASADEDNYVVLYSATKVEGQYEVYEKYTGVGGLTEQTIESDGPVTVTLDKGLYICIEVHASVSYYVNLPFASFGTYAEYPDVSARGTWEITRHGSGDLWSVGEVNVGFELYKHKVTVDGEPIDSANWAVNGRMFGIGHPDPDFETHDGYTFDKYIVIEGEKTTLCAQDTTYGEVYGELTIYSRWSYEVTVNVKTVSDDPDAVGGIVTLEEDAPLPAVYYWSMDQEETLLYFRAEEGYLVSKVEYDCNGDIGEENYPVGQNVYFSSFGVVGKTTLTVTFSKVYHVSVNITEGEELGAVTITNRTTGQPLHHGDAVYAGSSIKIVVGPTRGNFMVVLSKITCPDETVDVSGGTYDGAIDYVGTSFLKGDIEIELKFVKGYTVTLDGEEQWPTVMEGASYPLPAAPAAREGYDFAGWKVTKTQSGEVIEEHATPETGITVTCDITVAEVWEYEVTSSITITNKAALGAGHENDVGAYLYFGDTNEAVHETYSEGETISIRVVAQEGYRLVKATVTFADGSTDEAAIGNGVLWDEHKITGIDGPVSIKVEVAAYYTIELTVENMPEGARIVVFGNEMHTKYQIVTQDGEYTIVADKGELNEIMFLVLDAYKITLIDGIYEDDVLYTESPDYGEFIVPWGESDIFFQNGEKTLGFSYDDEDSMAAIEENGNVLAFKAIYELYTHTVKVNGEDSGKSVTNGDKFTITEDLAHPAKPEQAASRGEWHLFYILNGKYYSVDDVIENVREDLELTAEWVEAYKFTYTIEGRNEDNKDVVLTVTGPDDRVYETGKAYYVPYSRTVTLNYENSKSDWLVYADEVNKDQETKRSILEDSTAIHGIPISPASAEVTLKLSFHHVHLVLWNPEPSEKANATFEFDGKGLLKPHFSDAYYYEEGSEVTIKITPVQGRRVDCVYINGNKVAVVDNTVTFNVDDYNKGETFVFTITVSVETVRVYTVTVDGDLQEETVDEGGSYTLPAAPAARTGYTFAGWEVDGELHSAQDVIEDVREDLVVTSKWTFKVTVENGEGGDKLQRYYQNPDRYEDWTVDETYTEGDAVNFYVTAKPGYRIAKFITHVEGYVNPLVTEFNSSVLTETWYLGLAKTSRVEVVYEKVYMITVTGDNIGEFTVNVDDDAFLYYDEETNTYTLDANTMYAILVTPADGYMIKKVTNTSTGRVEFDAFAELAPGLGMNGGSEQYGNGYAKVALVMDTAFSIETSTRYTVTVDRQSSSLGDFTRDVIENYEYPLPQPGTKDGYRFAGWKVEGIDGIGDELKQAGETITIGASDVTVTAQWVQVVTVSMKVNGESHGTIELKKADGTLVNDGETLDVGTMVSIHIKADDGYKVLIESGAIGFVSITDSLMPEISIEEFAVQEVGISFTVRFEAISYTVSVPSVEGVQSATLDKVEGKYTVGETVQLTVTAETGYKLVSVTAEDVDVSGGEGGVYTFTMPASDVTVTIQVEKQYKVTVADGSSEHAQVNFTDGQKDWYDNGETVEFTVTAIGEYVVTSVKAGSDVLTEEGGKYSVTLNGADIEITVETVEKIDKPITENGDNQGEWKGVTQDAVSLQINADSIVIGDEYVTEISDNGLTGGEIVYNLKTEDNKTYTLAWFGQEADYVLVLTDTTPVASASRARVRVASAGGVSYYVSPAVGEDNYKAAYDAALGGEWKNGEKVLNITDDAGKIGLTLDGSKAEYVIKVGEEKKYLVIMENASAAYVLTVTDSGNLKLNEDEYTKKSDARVTGVESALLRGELLVITVTTEGYAQDANIEGVSLVYGDNLSMTPSGTNRIGDKFELFFNGIVNLASGTYTLKLKIGETEYTNIPVGDSATFDNGNGKTYTLESDGNSLTLKIESKVAPQMYDVYNAELLANATQIKVFVRGNDGYTEDLVKELKIAFVKDDLEGTIFYTQGYEQVEKGDVYYILTLNMPSDPELATGVYTLKLVDKSNSVVFDSVRGTSNVETEKMTFTLKDGKLTVAEKSSDPVYSVSSVTVSEGPTLKVVLDAENASIDGNTVFTLEINGQTVTGTTQDNGANATYTFDLSEAVSELAAGDYEITFKVGEVAVVFSSSIATSGSYKGESYTYSVTFGDSKLSLHIADNGSQPEGTVENVYNPSLDSSSIIGIWFQVNGYSKDDMQKVELWVNGEKYNKEPYQVQTSGVANQYRPMFDGLIDVLQASDGAGYNNTIEFKFMNETYSPTTGLAGGPYTDTVNGKVYTFLVVDGKLAVNVKLTFRNGTISDANNDANLGNWYSYGGGIDGFIDVELHSDGTGFKVTYKGQGSQDYERQFIYAKSAFTSEGNKIYLKLTLTITVADGGDTVYNYRINGNSRTIQNGVTETFEVEFTDKRESENTSFWLYVGGIGSGKDVTIKVENCEWNTEQTLEPVEPTLPTYDGVEKTVNGSSFVIESGTCQPKGDTIGDILSDNNSVVSYKFKSTVSGKVNLSVMIQASEEGNNGIDISVNSESTQNVTVPGGPAGSWWTVGAQEVDALQLTLVADQEYEIKIAFHCKANFMSMTLAPVPPQLSYESAELRQGEAGGVYVVLTLSKIENCELNDLIGLTWTDTDSGKSNRPVSVTKVETVDGKYELWFEITNSTPDGEWIRMKELKLGNVSVNLPDMTAVTLGPAKSLTVNDVAYGLGSDQYLYFLATQKFTLTFKYDDGTDKAETAEVTHSKEYTLSDGQKNPIRKGYDFLGWYLDADGDGSIGDGETATIADNKVTNVTANATYIAKWALKNNQISIETKGEQDGGTVTTDPENTVESFNKVTVTLTVNAGYRATVMVGGSVVLENKGEGTHTYEIPAEEVYDNISIVVTFEKADAEVKYQVSVNPVKAGDAVEDVAQAVLSIEGTGSFEAGTPTDVSFVVADGYGVVEISGTEIEPTIEKVEGGYKYTFANVTVSDASIAITVKVGKRLTSNRTWSLVEGDHIKYVWEWFNDTQVDGSGDGTITLMMYDVTQMGDEALSKDFLLEETFATMELASRTWYTWKSIDAVVEAALDGEKPDQLKLVLAFVLHPNTDGKAAGYTDSVLYYATVDGNGTTRDLKVYNYATDPVISWDKAYIETENDKVYLVFTISEVQNVTEEDLKSITYAVRSEDNGPLTVAKLDTTDGYKIYFDLTGMSSNHDWRFWGTALKMNDVTLAKPEFAGGVTAGYTHYNKRIYRLGGDFIAVMDYPTFTFVKGDGEGADPVVTELGNPADNGMMDCTLPECTYTAPAGKYFRGWEIDGVTYYPGEKYNVKYGTEVTATAVWADLIVPRETDATGKILNWFTAGSLSASVSEGETIRLEVVLTHPDSTLNVWDGILTDIGANDDFYRLRVDPAFTTNGGGNTWDNSSYPTVQYVEVVSTDWDGAAYTALYANGGSAIQVITASLKDNVLTYTVENYASTDVGHETCVAKTTFRLTSTTDVSVLTLGFYLDNVSLTSGTLTDNVILSANQAPTVENPIEVGTEGNGLPYTGDTPSWLGNLKKGEKVVMKGTMTSDGGENFHAPIMYLYNGTTTTFNFRADNYINGNTSNNQWPMTTPNGWSVSSDGANTSSTVQPVDGDGDTWWNGVRQIFTAADVEITFDYTGENVVVRIQATGTGENDNKGKKFICTYTVTGVTDGELTIGLGGESCYVVIDSLTRTSVKA